MSKKPKRQRSCHVGVGTPAKSGCAKVYDTYSAPSLGDQGPHLKHGSLGLSRVHTPNKTSIGSAGFAWLAVVTDKHTDT